GDAVALTGWPRAPRGALAVRGMPAMARRPHRACGLACIMRSKTSVPERRFPSRDRIASDLG
ncbi:hypothetical protein ABZR37_28355, partial [Achromobacter ruhlandii]|uniref:hypothetical protein n=1 Tax=Achromobacter ruhlandii TaxID=72557 RepID=UPI003556C6BF